MSKEIERKFLVNNYWKTPEAGTVIKQGYLSSDPEKAIRVRISDEKAYLTLKKQVSDLTREEFEFPIPLNKAQELLQSMCRKPFIEKTRYLIQHEGFTWEVDVFSGENEGLIVAEIELDSESQKFDLPVWAGDEVTLDARYLNINLIDNPYKKWKTGN